jgi:simple sugar transport system substrate-binding protein
VSRAARLCAAALAVALLVSGCDLDDGGGQVAGTTTSTTTSTEAARIPTPVSPRDLRIVVITHGEASDPFWVPVRNGLEQAARDVGVDVSYRAPDVYNPGRMRLLVEAAVAERPDGLVVTLPDPRTLAPALKKAERAGIPVVAINSGADVYRRLGALLFVGQPAYATGLAVGRRMAAAGVRTALCVVHQAAVVSLQQRCRGFAAGLASAGGRSIVVEIELQQQQEAVGRLVGWLAGASTPIDGLLAVGPAAATPSLAALRAAQAFDKVMMATFDLAPDIVRALRLGQIDFAIDQQPYLQGYLPIVFLAQRARYGLMPAVGTTIETGPEFVTAREAARVSRLIDAGLR